MSPDFSDLDALIADDLALRAAAHQLRQRRTVTPLTSTRVRIDGVTYVNFASNNYLGLTHHPRLIAAAQACVAADGVGSGAAALITGHTLRHTEAEEAIARWKGAEDAVLLPSGYQANLAAVQALAVVGERSGRGVRFLVDKLAHASLIDAVRATGAAFRVFPHNGLGKVARLLEAAPAGEIQVVLTESVFSMDGDTADLAGLVALKRQRPFVLLLDEAHGSGVYGPGGAGYAAELGLQGDVDVSVVTLSKALGCGGGAVCGSREFCAAVVNFGRAYIYSTSVPPVVAAVAAEAIRVMADEPERQGRVRALAVRVREAVARSGIALPAGDSPIIPIILGDDAETLAAARRLAEARLLVPAVRPPTVPKGGSRLRVTISADHTDEDVQQLIDVMATWKDRMSKSPV